MPRCWLLPTRDFRIPCRVYGSFVLETAVDDNLTRPDGSGEGGLNPQLDDAPVSPSRERKSPLRVKPSRSPRPVAASRRQCAALLSILRPSSL